MNNAIELAGVTKRFAKQVAVDNLDLNVPVGSIYGFIGPNGSGKTTTLRMILRIFQPDSGSVTVLGERHGKTADDRLGYLPEERGLYKRMRVGSLLTYYARLKGNYDCQKHLQEWLTRLEASDWVNKRIDTLSKGMAQKVQFIAAVAGNPQLVILDEPFTGLDPVNMEALREAVKLLRERGNTVIFSTHDMEMAEKLCDTIFMIHKGHKVLDGTIDTIQAHYPANRVRVRFADPDLQVPEIRQVTAVETQGREFQLIVEDHSQSGIVLEQLSRHGELHRFEVIKPSLHDIFIEIAKPAAEEMAAT
ncbi:MAG: ABC transporter ATP-binding protein [Pirellulaceae bacterium]